jgi:formate-dependent phosphoribosylglycinamide formyltransferase (GAR transformylase)
VVGATTIKAWRTATRAATVLEDEVRDPGRRIVYNGSVLFDLMITFLVVRSCQEQPRETLNHVRSK